MKLDDGRLTFVAQQEVTALDAIHKAALGKAACAGRVTEGVGTCISIHAPTWGATVTGISERDIMSFQSTHPRGVRHGASVEKVLHDHFNPRTHVGCDDKDTFCDRWIKFQSTHPRGVRLQIIPCSDKAVKFQSTHPRGVRPN